MSSRKKKRTAKTPSLKTKSGKKWNKDGKRVKIVSVGDGGIGKHTLAIRFIRDQFFTDYQPIIFEHYTSNIKIENEIVDLDIWCTAGQEEYDQIRLLSYPDTDIFQICFSLVEPKSLENVTKKWWNEIMEHNSHTTCPIILVGLQSDRITSRENWGEHSNGVISQEEIMRVVYDLGFSGYYECSSKTNSGVREVYENSVKLALNETRRVLLSNRTLLIWMRYRFSSGEKLNPTYKYDEEKLKSALATMASKRDSEEKKNFEKSLVNFFPKYRALSGLPPLDKKYLKGQKKTRKDRKLARSAKKMNQKVMNLRKQQVELMRDARELERLQMLIFSSRRVNKILNFIRETLEINKMRKSKVVDFFENKSERYSSSEFSEIQKKFSGEEYQKSLDFAVPINLPYEDVVPRPVEFVEMKQEKKHVIYIGETRRKFPMGEGVLFKHRGIRKTYGLYFKGFFDNLGQKCRKGVEFDLKTGKIIYEGQYKNDYRHGRGADFDLKSFHTRRGIWEKGELIKQESRYEFGTISFSEIEKQLIPKNEIGRGGNATVYDVLWRENRRAAKIASFGQTDNLLFQIVKRSVRNSLSLIASLSHGCENIIKIIGYIEGRRKVGYLMEKCVCDVNEIITRGGIEFKEKLRILENVANGMKFLHSKEIMNRDLKPSNCLVREDGTIVLTDLDTAKEDESLWRNNAINTASSIGTPVFLAPELISKKYDKRIDVFSFGIMIYTVIFQLSNPYSETFECPGCNEKIQSMNSYAFPMHVRDCGLRPLIDFQKQSSLKKDEVFVIDLMRSCWSTRPEQRPTFEEISYLLGRKLNSLKDRIIRISVKGSKSVVQQERIILIKKTVSALKNRIHVRWPDSKIIQLMMLNHPDGSNVVLEDGDDLELENFVMGVEDPVVLVEFEEIPMEEDLLTVEDLFQRYKKEKERVEGLEKRNQELVRIIRKMEEQQHQ